MDLGQCPRCGLHLQKVSGEVWEVATLVASILSMQLVQGWECKDCYWGINNKALSSSNTHARIDCYLCFAFSFLWLLLHSSRECTAKWIGLCSNWYAANVLKYLCSNRFVTLVCLGSTEVGARSFSIACTEERRANSHYIFSSIFFGNHAAPWASLEVMVIQFI